MKKLIHNQITILFILAIGFSSLVFADFLPTSPFWGISDGAIIVKRIDGIVAMEDKDGNRYNLPESYKSVSDFTNGICTIVVRTNESGGNILGIISNKIVQKAFYLKEENGRLVRVDIDFLKFHCREI